MKKRFQKMRWMGIALLLALLLMGAYYSVSRALSDLNMQTDAEGTNPASAL
jgi:hypothetical protein